MPPEVPHVTAVVLNWNGLDDTRRSVASLLAQTHARLRVIVVDNASENGEADRIAAEFGDRVELLRNTTNLGFTTGHAGAIASILSRGESSYVALLNNDAFAAPDWIARLVAAAEGDASIGLCASLMVWDDDPERVENAGIAVLPTGDALPRGRGRLARSFTATERIAGACGGACLLRTAMLAQLGGFRADFFINFEDVDLSLRALACGWDCAFVPDAVVRHRLGSSFAKARDAERNAHSVRNAAWAWLVNAPLSVLVLTAPLWLASWALMPLVALLLRRRALARMAAAGRWRALHELGAIRRARRALRAQRRSPLRFLCRLSWSPRAFACLVAEARRPRPLVPSQSRANTTSDQNVWS